MAHGCMSRRLSLTSPCGLHFEWMGVLRHLLCLAAARQGRVEGGAVAVVRLKMRLLAVCRCRARRWRIRSTPRTLIRGRMVLVWILGQIGIWRGRMCLRVDDWRCDAARRRRLNVCRAGLLLEDGVVAQTLAFGLVAVATRWLSLVTLCTWSCQSSSQASRIVVVVFWLWLWLCLCLCLCAARSASWIRYSRN